MSDRTSEFFDRYAVDFDSIYGNDDRALERIANRLFRGAMLLRYQKTMAGCQPVAGKRVIVVYQVPLHERVAEDNAADRGAWVGLVTTKTP